LPHPNFLPPSLDVVEEVEHVRIELLEDGHWSRFLEWEGARASVKRFDNDPTTTLQTTG
jgi:hypothetical protein